MWLILPIPLKFNSAGNNNMLEISQSLAKQYRVVQALVVTREWIVTGGDQKKDLDKFEL